MYYAPQTPCCTPNQMVNNPCLGGDPCSAQPISSNNIGYVGSTLPCTNIKQCDTLTVVFSKAEEKICQLKEKIVILKEQIDICCPTTTTTSTTRISTSTTTSTSSTSSTTSTSSSSTSTTSSTSSTSSTTSTTSSTSSTSSTTSTSTSSTSSTTSTTSSTSSTSSTTTTTTTIACTEFSAVNNFIGPTEVYWTDCCDKLPRMQTLAPDLGTTFCSITTPTSPKATITLVGPCNPCTSTTTTTSSTTTGYPVDVRMSDAPLDACTGAIFNNLYIKQGFTFTTATILYQNPSCTIPFNITSFIYIVRNIVGTQTIFGFDPLTGEILTSTGNSCFF